MKKGDGTNYWMRIRKEKKKLKEGRRQKRRVEIRIWESKQGIK